MGHYDSSYDYDDEQQRKVVKKTITNKLDGLTITELYAVRDLINDIGSLLMIVKLLKRL